MRSWLSRVTVVTLVLLLVGCSSAQFGYSTLPWLLTWRFERDLGLDEDQRWLVKERVDALQRWHRASELPRYAEFLRRVAAEPAPVSEATVAGWRAELARAWEPIARRAAPDLAALALTLRPEQIDRLARRFAERNDELRREWGLPANGLSPVAASRVAKGVDPLVEARIERFRERAEFFMGSLDEKQRAALARLAATHPASEADWMAEREARQRKVLALLRGIARDRPAPEVAEARVREALLAAWEGGDPATADRLAEAASATDRIAATLLNGASPGQRARVADRLLGWAQDFAAIAAR